MSALLATLAFGAGLFFGAVLGIMVMSWMIAGSKEPEPVVLRAIRVQPTRWEIN